MCLNKACPTSSRSTPSKRSEIHRANWVEPARGGLSWSLLVASRVHEILFQIRWFAKQAWNSGFLFLSYFLSPSKILTLNLLWLAFEQRKVWIFLWPTSFSATHTACLAFFHRFEMLQCNSTYNFEWNFTQGWRKHQASAIEPCAVIHCNKNFLNMWNIKNVSFFLYFKFES